MTIRQRRQQVVSEMRIPDGKADRAAERREFLETTPGQRVEEIMAFSEEMSKLAIRGLERAQAERS